MSRRLVHRRRGFQFVATEAVAFTAPEARSIWDQRIETARRDGVASLAPASLERWLTPDFQRAHPEVVEQIRDVYIHTSVEGFALACAALREFDVRDRLMQIRTPTLTVAGRYDTGTPPAATQVIADAIRGARFEVLDAAHLAPIEQSQRFAALLETFLQSRV